LQPAPLNRGAASTAAAVDAAVAAGAGGAAAGVDATVDAVWAAAGIGNGTSGNSSTGDPAAAGKALADALLAAGPNDVARLPERLTEARLRAVAAIGEYIECFGAALQAGGVWPLARSICVPDLVLGPLPAHCQPIAP
jgi:hypothetical protein